MKRGGSNSIDVGLVIIIMLLKLSHGVVKFDRVPSFM